VPTLPVLWQDDVTPEALSNVIQEQGGRMLLMSPEGDLFSFMAGRYNQSPNLGIYKKGWSGKEGVRDERMGRDGHDVRDPALSVGICVQPEVLQRLKEAQSFRGQGILARFMWMYPKSLVGWRENPSNAPALDTAAAAQYDRRVRDLLSLARPEEPPVMRLTTDAAAIHSEFYDAIEKRQRPDGDLRHIADWANKLPGQVARIAGVLAIAEDGAIPGEVSADAMLRAVDIGRSLIPHALAVFGLIGADERTEMARYVLQRIVGHWEVGFTTADLWRACRDKVDLVRPEDLQEPLALLEEAGHVAIIDQKSTGPGRPPSPLVELNPKSTKTRI